MAEPAFSSKRKPEPDAQDNQHILTKTPKLATLDHHESQEPYPNSNDNASQLPSTAHCSSESVIAPKEGGNDDNELQNDTENEKELEDDDEDDDDDEDEENHEVDRKGKGVMRDDKGKGKLIEEEDDDDSDDDDSDDDGSGSGDDSDFSDDPLAEVDLNNILPSRTRRRTAHSGVHIAGDTGNAGGEDDDDSDDSDA
ncbi:hypothetical protein VNO77_16672 [Canavalia gladiata]|uniref:Uncharacterized protein n=1 Tax=Canavalia gladiata TaxID=3824 RepID=A0AAN9QI03_CANGL